ncbi:hypothetical protein CTI12_AA556650 [Artemisia annua]|uniref:Uncharacterized protein n=1 Tax=Artemisia annua TaxID=35608 RepID=A0A2U1KWI6_ARTAN|nr:hypothetical protein CTI12_AA556650 [Artemisia annua]
MTTQVYQEIQEVLGDFNLEISLSHWSIVEYRYQQKFNKSPDYPSLGVTDVTQLHDKMGEKVVLFEKREWGETYVMSALVAKFRRKIRLRPLLKNYSI